MQSCKKQPSPQTNNRQRHTQKETCVWFHQQMQSVMPTSGSIHPVYASVKNNNNNNQQMHEKKHAAGAEVAKQRLKPNVYFLSGLCLDVCISNWGKGPFLPNGSTRTSPALPSLDLVNGKRGAESVGMSIDSCLCFWLKARPWRKQNRTGKEGGEGRGERKVKK